MPSHLTQDAAQALATMFKDQPNYTGKRYRITPIPISLTYAAGSYNTRRGVGAMLKSKHDEITRWLFPLTTGRADHDGRRDADDRRYDHLFPPRTYALLYETTRLISNCKSFATLACARYATLSAAVRSTMLS